MTEKALNIALSRTRFNRDLVALGALAEVLRDQLEAFTDEHDYDSVAAELVRAGALSPTDVGAPLVAEVLDVATFAPEDAAGLLWATKVFISVVDGYACPINDDDAGADAIPCAIVGTKGGA